MAAVLPDHDYGDLSIFSSSLSSSTSSASVGSKASQPAAGEEPDSRIR